MGSHLVGQHLGALQSRPSLQLVESLYMGTERKLPSN
jgi:hypothetical protein